MSERLVRAYQTLTGVLAIEKAATSESQLLSEICRLAVEDAGYRMAWIGYADPQPGRVRPVAHFGCEQGYLGSIDVTWDEGPTSRGPTGTAIRTRKTSVAQNILTTPEFEPWRAEAVKRGYGSSIGLVLQSDGEVYGALNLYALEPNAFDAEELALLEQVAHICSRGISCARGASALNQIEQQLQRVDRVDTASRVAATIAHDVNNCLAVMLPCLDLMGSSPAAADARAAVERAIALNRELLRLGQSNALAEPSVSLDALLRSSAATLEVAAAPCRLSFQLSADPWQSRVAAAQLERVLMNLVINARDASPPGAQISVQTRPLALRHPLAAPYVGIAAGDYLSMRVIDEGEGISAEVRKRLFEPFFTTKGDRGTGLGLASVFGIVRQLGGGVFVQSEPGRGASFEVLLPRAP